MIELHGRRMSVDSVSGFTLSGLAARAAEPQSGERFAKRATNFFRPARSK